MAVCDLHHQYLVALEPLLARCTAAPHAAGEQLLRVAELTLAANEKINLTADDEPQLFWPRHIEDSLQAAALLTNRLPAEVLQQPILDVGTGGGMPGLVWGILWPSAPLSLLEARQRRADWLRDACGALAFPYAQIFAARAETLGQDPAHRETYSLVTARALARLAALLEFTLPFARIGGYVAAIKSADCLEELHEAEFALQELGSERKAVELLPYTRSDGKACVVLLIPKLRPTPAAYPRREGIPAHHPL